MFEPWNHARRNHWNNGSNRGTTRKESANVLEMKRKSNLRTEVDIAIQQLGLLMNMVFRWILWSRTAG
ncbi:hypothetical protein V6N11_013367 [Hibiscus sabdariffa]|uniref:Uncharacterized protein n=1 Tax=Hibiscus sabdariffa TaxID=183260 RepID=A0ABR2NNN0_9ROSI